MQLTQLAILVVAAATSVQGAAIPAELQQRDPLFGLLSFSGSFDADWNSLYRLAGHQNVYDMCCSVIKPKTSTLYETTTVTVPSVVKATATATTTATVHKQTTITQHVRSTKTVATVYETSTATVTAAAEYHKRFFNLLWNSFFQKLYLKDAALTEIKCAALGYKPAVVYVHVPKTETVCKTSTEYVATNTKTETKTILEPTTTTLVEHVPVTATQKVTVTTTVPAPVPTKAPAPSYPTCSGSGSSGSSWALYTGVSYSLDSFYSFGGCGDVQSCTNECNNSWSKHGKECAGVQWNPTSKVCSLKGEASTAAKFSFGFDFSSSLFLIKGNDCQSNSLWAPTQGNDCCCNYKA